MLSSNVDSVNQNARESSNSLNIPYFGSSKSFSSSIKNSFRTPPASSASSSWNLTYKIICVY